MNNSEALAYIDRLWNNYGVLYSDKKNAGHEEEAELMQKYFEALGVAKDAIKALELTSELEKNSKKLEKDFGELDCISREQALKALKESAEHHANDSREEVLLRRDRDIIRALPSVTPQPCEDAVSRQAVLDLIADYDLSMGQVVKGIHALPSVISQEPKTGHWIEEFNDIEGEVRFTCSCCGKYQLFGTDFCYNCGAKMVEPQESEDKE